MARLSDRRTGSSRARHPLHGPDLQGTDQTAQRRTVRTGNGVALHEMELYQHDLLFLRLRLSDCVRVYEQQHMARVRGRLSCPCRDHWQGIQKQIIRKTACAGSAKISLRLFFASRLFDHPLCRVALSFAESLIFRSITKQ